MEYEALEIEDVPLDQGERQGVPLDPRVGRDRRRINIIAGGTRFTTTRATLTSRDLGSKLAKLVPKTNLNHHYFLDINPNVFGHILDYLRYGKLVLPDNFDQNCLLREQARQLGIASLLDEVEEDSSEASSSENDLRSSPPRKKAKPRRRKTKKEWTGRQEMEHMFERLEEGFQGLITGLEQKINNIEKDDTRLEDQRMEKLVKKLEDGIQRVADNSERSVEILRNQELRKMYQRQLVRAPAAPRQEDQRMETLVQKLEDGIQRVADNSERSVEISSNQELRKMYQRQAERAPSAHAGVITVIIYYHKPENCFYEIDIISEPNMSIQLDVPHVAKQTETRGIFTWAYDKFSHHPWLTTNIACQLTVQGYKLITATECCANDNNGHPQNLQYVFVRS